MGTSVVATIVRKTGEGPAGQFRIVVRSSAMPSDIAITVSRDDYDHLHAGMLVTVFQVGWGPLSPGSCDHERAIPGGLQVGLHADAWMRRPPGPAQGMARYTVLALQNSVALRIRV